MDSMALEPLEMRDFSGGLTDNILQGDPKRYERADNFLLTVDHRLEVRPGTVVYDPVAYQINTTLDRVTSLFTAINETILFAHSGRSLYTQAPDSTYGTAWNEIKGPSGNPAVSGGIKYNQLTTAEFQRQIYFTSDALVPPGKVFRDQSNNWKALTSGLPRMSWTLNYPTDTSLLAACLNLANNLRTSMIAHFSDSAEISSGTSGIKQHKLTDKYSLGYLQAVTWVFTDTEYPGPTPAPTPAPAASALASLKTLCVALALAYEHHRNDLAGPAPTNGSGNKFYHQDILLQPDATGTSGSIPTNLGCNAKLTRSGVVSTTAKAAAFLDELAQKWYWHQLSPFSHHPSNDYPTMARYLVTAPKVGTIYTSPYTAQVSGTYLDFYDFAYFCKQALNKHYLGTDSTSGNMHAQTDLYGQITLPTPFDWDSATLTIFWARWMYGRTHYADSNISSHTNITFNSTAGSTTLAGVQIGGVNTQLPVGTWIMTTSATFDTPASQDRKATRVTSSGAGTAIVTRAALATASSSGQATTAWLHGSYANGAFTTSTSLKASIDAKLATGEGTCPSDTASWLTLGTEFLSALAAHESDATVHKQAGSVSTDVQGVGPKGGNPFYVPSVATLAYAAIYRYQYTVEPNGLLYLNRSNPVFSLSTETIASYPVGTVLAAYSPSFNSATISQENVCGQITGIPALVNTLLTNYDTSVSVAPTPDDSKQNLTIELYRTTDGGTTFYLLDEITNGTTTYSDSVNENYPKAGDAALFDREVLYTSGGVVANDPPPQCKFVHHFNGYNYYAGIEDSGQFLPYRIRQSLQLATDSAPATFADDLEDEVVGLSSTRSNLVAFGTNSLYRCEGAFNSLGVGSMVHTNISSGVGALNARSIVKTEIGIFFAGTDGFYYTDGFQLIKVSLELDKIYQKHTKTDAQKARIYGAYDKLNRRIWWAMQSQETASDNDVFFVFYLNYGVKPSGVFTKALTSTSWMPSSAVFYKGNLIIGDSRGYLFKTETNTKTDPKINTSVAPSLWTETYIPWYFKSCALDFGTTFEQKWVPSIHVVGKNVGNASIQINSINQNNETGNTKALPALQYTKNFTWGDPTFVWGSSACVWKYDGMIDAWRPFPAGSMRSDFKQIEFVPGNFVLYKYDSYPPFSFATVDATAKTATIQTPAGFTSILWPLDVIDYSISFDTNNYATSYLITTIDSTKKIITFQDTNNTSLPAAGAKWQIQGVRKHNRIQITSLDVHFSVFGETQNPYPGDSLAGGFGKNA